MFFVEQSVKGLAALCEEHLRGRYRLPHMPLRVIGNVHENSGHGGRQILSANRTRLVQSVLISAQLQNSGGTVC